MITGRTASQILDSQRILLEKEIQRAFAAFEEETGCLIQAVQIERGEIGIAIAVSFTVPRSSRSGSGAAKERPPAPEPTEQQRRDMARMNGGGETRGDE